MKYEDLVSKVLSYNPKADTALLRLAYDFAAEAHSQQKRYSGDPYITHPLAVAMILAELELDLETIVAGILHDVVEDSDRGLTPIREIFGDEVAQLVDGVTKLGRLEFRSKEEQQAENLRKMLLAMARDIRVILIKLADRLHNLRTLGYHSPAKQREIAQETLEIFAPLAHRLGIYHLKWELEDLAFRYLEPESYHSLAANLAETRAVRERQIQEVIDILDAKIQEVGITADIQGRPKHLYSIYLKMVDQEKDLADIYDVSGVRIIVHSVRDCYATLGVVHTIFKPIPGRFKDYIAMPKSNMYQSLHTTVVGPKGRPVEIQIRTWEMHRTAEYGIAAHWRYKAGGRGDREFDAKLAWLRQLMDWQHELRDAREFMESLKIDIFADVVFVFTPHGDVIELPAGSIPLDFAYRIHTDIGHRCIGARVNGRLVPLDYRLKNGDIVEIITAKHPAPSRDWLAIVKTSQAKTKIRNWFKKEQREDNVGRGREALEREAKKQGLDLELLRSEKALEVGRRYTLNSMEDLYAAVGLGVIAPATVVQRLKEQARPAPQIPELRPDSRRWSKAMHGILVKDAGNVLVRLAHCCNPVPGDPIVGYITRGRGVSVHRADCRNVVHWQAKEKERLVEVKWDGHFDQPFQVRLEVVGLDRPGLLGDVMNALADMKISASWVTARGGRERDATIDLTLEVRDLEQFQFTLNKLQKIRDVFEVRRSV
ncbi:MAG: bifunctional (p)ppGpp synthetase/guanosine-3',5'-bis(diphosphate) 3'-pyrophosphohydrolase [Bacillota bacterium]|nr:bifunctional (p)ppGpp synthetase/guanosine-3',5'-bis(diphosphate) 3'-pyrophosphohydrolase [Bacillota bacterium]